MFSALSQTPGVSLETRKVLIIINLQNDSLITNGDLQITANHDFVDKIGTVVPHFRSMGDVIWVRTEISRRASPATLDPAQVEAKAAKTNEKNKQERKEEERNLTDDTSSIESDKGIQHYHPTSRVKARMKQASAKTRLDQRTANMEAFDDVNETFEDYMTKPRKGREPAFYVGGTHGAELADEVLPVVDLKRDMVLTKHYYSAFDQTSLLMSLRMKLVTEIYLCGCLTNVGIYATAADAVQHGMYVTVIEDCLGYRSEDKHLEALRQMSDIMGVHGIDSEDIIDETGGAAPPDVEVPIFTGPGVEGISMHSLSLAGSRRASHESEAGLHVGPAVGPTVKIEEGASEKPHRPTALRKISDIPTANPSELRTRPTSGPPTKRDSIQAKGTPTASRRTSLMKHRESLTMSSRTLGPQDPIGSGDSRIIYDFLGADLISAAFTELKDGVQWQTMSHRSGEVPRLVAVQGETSKDGGIPIYRHPADESPPLLPFTSCVQKIRHTLEQALKQPFNHVLVQLYCDGKDNISEHSDKTLDIVKGSAIVNVSIGAQRVMTLRTKKSNRVSGIDSPNASRQTQRIPMPHNSVFVLGTETNKQWLHGVRADKRPLQQKTEEEKSFGGERISLTFRHIGTFTDQDNKKIWGQGAREKNRNNARWVRDADGAEIEAMVIAFGKENHQTDFDWEAEYGKGFDAINLIINRQPKLLLCRNKVANLRVQLSLLEKNIAYELEQKPEQSEESVVAQKGQQRPNAWFHGLSNIEKPIFKDTGEESSEIEGDLAILFHLEKSRPYESSNEAASQESNPNKRYFSLTSQSNELLSAWQDLHYMSRDSKIRTPAPSERPSSSDNMIIGEFEKDLDMWEGYARTHQQFIAGDKWTLIDCAFWPVLNEIVHQWNGFRVQKYPHLSAYHERVLSRECVQQLLEHEE